MTTQNPILPNDAEPIGTQPWRRFFRALLARSAISGIATFNGGTTIAVTLAVPLPDADYTVLIDASENKTFWTTSRSQTGFTIHASGSTSVTVGYTLMRR